MKIFVSEFIPSPLRQLLAEKRLLLKAILENKVLGCNALQGESAYNICINSDMSVSCNCQDYDGKGVLGNLSFQTFPEIFNGITAQNFRKSLAHRKFPTPVCIHCNELSLIKKRDVDKYLKEYSLPYKGIMVENTSLCNLRCLMCDRKKILANRKQKSMSLKNIETISELIESNHIHSIAFFNLGEPFLSEEFTTQIQIIKNKNPNVYIYTSTNGVLLDNEEKIKGALLFDLIIFSIDGSSQEILTKYQRRGNFEIAYSNMKKLVSIRESMKQNKPIIEWKYVLFRWNDHPEQIEEAVRLAKEASVDIISFWPGGGLPRHKSKRYYYHPFYKNLGSPSWKGRELDLRLHPHTQ